MSHTFFILKVTSIQTHPVYIMCAQYHGGLFSNVRSCLEYCISWYTMKNVRELKISHTCILISSHGTEHEKCRGTEHPPWF